MRTRTTVVAAALAALFLFLPPPARPQSTGTAEGFVYDNDGNPLGGVQVLMQYKGHIPQRYRTKTDKTGKFVHVNVWEGPYDLTFSREDLGEVTVKDFRIRQIYAPDKPPTFRIAAKAPTPPPGAATPAGPTRCYRRLL